MKTYLRHKIINVIDIKELTALEYLDFEGKYKNYKEKHNFWEMCYVEKGEVTLFSEKGKRILKKNSISFISPDTMHSYFSSIGNESRVFVICFECTSQPLKHLGDMDFVLKGDLLYSMRSIISEYLNTFYMNDEEHLEVIKMPNFGGQQAIILQMEYLFIRLMRMLSDKGNSEIVFFHEDSFYKDLAEVIKSYLNTKVCDKLSLIDICSKVNYSRSFVCKTFKEQTGETLFTYYNRIKISEAKKLLKNTKLNMGEISERLGFGEAKYFGAVFKKHEGISPSLYREKYKEN